MIQSIFQSEIKNTPKVSIILIDWSVRESYHVLEYLGSQSVPREDYEIIWIEYYNLRAKGIEQLFEKAKGEGKVAPIDQWIVLGIPEDYIFHKHVIYNVGMALSRGSLVTICDSDAMMGPDFVRTIIESFEECPNMVLHFDQVRNHDKKFYPFNYPSIEDVIGEGAVNYKSGKTTGLWDEKDPLHTRNYGSCMSARRDDLLAIGGADEHLDYLGYVCGPYEMTFRLINYGCKEFWHPEELLYHVWHPGQSGDGSYVGPHDGRHMSTTALESKETKRVNPLVENDIIKSLREGAELSRNKILSELISPERMKEWNSDYIYTNFKLRIWYTNELLENYKGYEVVKHGSCFYGVPYYLGSIDLNVKSLIEHSDVLVADTVKVLKKAIDKLPPIDKKIYTYPLLRKLLGGRVYNWLHKMNPKKR